MTSTEWWTVPQSAAWIRTRDFDLVRGLDPFVELPMAMAEAVAPGAFEAMHLLNAALANDQFRARGRLALREMTETAWRWRYLETDVQHIPLSFWIDGAGDFAILSDGVAATSAATAGEYWADVAITADDCVVHWPRPASLLEAGSVRLVDIVTELQPEDCLAWWLAHPDVTVTGLDSTGVPVPVSRDIFRDRFEIDRDNNSLLGKGFRWPAAMVCLTSDAPQSAAPRAALLLADTTALATTATTETAPEAAPKAARKTGRKPRQRNKARGWIKDKHPEGIPDFLSDAAVVAAMAEDKIFVSERTVWRERRGK